MPYAPRRVGRRRPRGRLRHDFHTEQPTISQVPERCGALRVSALGNHDGPPPAEAVPRSRDFRSGCDGLQTIEVESERPYCRVATGNRDASTPTGPFRPRYYPANSAAATTLLVHRSNRSVGACLRRSRIDREANGKAERARPPSCLGIMPIASGAAGSSKRSSGKPGSSQTPVARNRPPQLAGLNRRSGCWGHSRSDTGTAG